MILPWLRGQDMKSQLQPLESSGSGRLPLNVPWWSRGGVGCWKFAFDIIRCLLTVNMLTICLSLIIIAWYGDLQYLAVLGYLYWSYMCRVGGRKVENPPSVATYWDLCFKGCLQLICWSFGATFLEMVPLNLPFWTHPKKKTGLRCDRLVQVFAYLYSRCKGASSMVIPPKHPQNDHF